LRSYLLGYLQVCGAAFLNWPLKDGMRDLPWLEAQRRFNQALAFAVIGLKTLFKYFTCAVAFPLQCRYSYPIAGKPCRY